MPVIGSFTLGKDGGWTGSIRTLTIDAKVRLVPNDSRENDRAPDFRVFAGQSRIGDAWDGRSGGDNPKYYLRVRIDDPSLAEPICAALFPSEDRQTAQLIWRRRRSSEG